MPAATAKLKWEGGKIRGKMARASEHAINKTMELCVAEAKMNHGSPTKKKPHSDQGEDYYNQTSDLTNSIRVFEFALAQPARGAIGTPGAGQFAAGGAVTEGTWGSDMEYALYLEIGTSRQGPTAEQRVQSAHGDMNTILPPIGPRMAARHTLYHGMREGIPLVRDEGYMRPAADKFYPNLATLVHENYEKMRGVGDVLGEAGASISYISPIGRLPIP